MEHLEWLRCSHRKLVARMAFTAVALLLGFLSLCPRLGGSTPGIERGHVQLRRIRSLATNSNYGKCWARALEQLDAHCTDMTSESQGLLALKFTHCHLSSSGRNFPACPEGSGVSRCTASMDTVAFNTYTEFFTHAHAICHFLESEAWHSRAEDTMHRLTENSAGVVEQLESTKQMAEELMEAQNVALRAQQEILDNGEELRVTLRDSTQELPDDGGAQCRFLSVQCRRPLRLLPFHRHAALLQGQVAVDGSGVYELLFGEEDLPEVVSVYVDVLRRCMMVVAVLVLLWVCARYTDPSQQSLLVLQQLQDTQCRLQEALQRAESFGQCKMTEDPQLEVKARWKESPKKKGRCEGERHTLVAPSMDAHLSITGWSSDGHLSSALNTTVTHNSVQPIDAHDASVTPRRRPRQRSSSSSPLVYSIPVEGQQLDQVQPRYSLRSRRSQKF
ncbi:uncharacterized protein LOC144014905 isoform X2 [Festucalex cinctus]